VTCGITADHAFTQGFVQHTCIKSVCLCPLVAFSRSLRLDSEGHAEGDSGSVHEVAAW
jgi:hypothetical protein